MVPFDDGTGEESGAGRGCSARLVSWSQGSMMGSEGSPVEKERPAVLISGVVGLLTETTWSVGGVATIA